MYLEGQHFIDYPLPLTLPLPLPPFSLSLPSSSLSQSSPSPSSLSLLPLSFPPSLLPSLSFLLTPQSLTSQSRPSCPPNCCDHSSRGHTSCPGDYIIYMQAHMCTHKHTCAHTQAHTSTHVHTDKHTCTHAST